jgi:flagellar basal body-associated protein FliL
MNRQETDKEARATKNTGNVWKWILGVGIVLMLVAFWGGFFNHNENFSESENASQESTAVTDSLAADTTNQQVSTDTINKDVRENQ